jgi:hypothetical protein
MKRIFILAALCLLCTVSCKKYDDEIAELQRQIDALVTANSRVNDNVAALEKLVEALQNKAEVTTFTKIVESGKVVGYTVTFKEEGKPAETVTVYDSPANVSVGESGGKYYWMVGGNWLTDDAGNRIEACAAAVVPEFRLTNGVIEVSLDGGITWKAVGEVGQPMVENVVETDTAVTFSLAGGSTISIPKQQPLTLTLSSTSLSMAAGGGRSVSYTISGGTESAEVIVYAKDGWTATVTKTDGARGYISINSPSEASQSQVLVFLSDDGRSVVTAINVTATAN